MSSYIADLLLSIFQAGDAVSKLAQLKCIMFINTKLYYEEDGFFEKCCQLE